MDWKGIATRVGRSALRSALKEYAPSPRRRARRRESREPGRRLIYAPKPNGQADPGEVVWAWVAYEEDRTTGKDRPVLVVGRDGLGLLGLMLSSNAERDGEPGWLSLGAGPWDGEHRPSWIRLDRTIRLTPDAVRREGAVLDRRRFDRVAAALRRDHGW